jgi:hypothetical protein
MYCRQVLLDAARKVGIEGAEELLEDPIKGADEVCLPVTNSVPGAMFLSWQGSDPFCYQKVQEELKKYSSDISGVPHFVVWGFIDDDIYRLLSVPLLRNLSIRYSLHHLADQ